MAKDPTFPFYAQDYLIDTLRWTRCMQGLHVSLLAESWANKEILDENGHPEGLGSTDVEIWLKIKHKWTLIEGIWKNEKLEVTRIARENFRQKQSDKGKLSADKRASVKKSTQPKTKTGSTVVEPLESESENESENKIKKEADLVYPFNTEDFFRAWGNWLNYRNDIKKPYRSILSQQAALKKLSEHSEEVAIKMIEESIANSWQGIFKLNEQTNGPGKKDATNARREGFAKRHSSGAR